jgi:hypothetical protein
MSESAVALRTTPDDSNAAGSLAGLSPLAPAISSISTHVYTSLLDLVVCFGCMQKGKQYFTGLLYGYFI